MTHTPGPWTISVLMELKDDGSRMPASYIESSGGWANSGTAGKRTVAIVGHWLDRPNPEADAALIAAAPELLEALKRAKKMLGPHSLVSDAMGYAMIDAAIEKAGG